MSGSLTIARRFRGPETSGNGGYTCGLIARFIAGDAEVTLRRPPPLDRPLTVTREGGRVLVHDGPDLIAEAVPSPLDLEVPAAPTPAEAEAAVPRYAGFIRHFFPGCFVCGPERAAGDGLRLFPGRVPGWDRWPPRCGPMPPCRRWAASSLAKSCGPCSTAPAPGLWSGTWRRREWSWAAWPPG